MYHNNRWQHWVAFHGQKIYACMFFFQHGWMQSGPADALKNKAKTKPSQEHRLRLMSFYMCQNAHMQRKICQIHQTWKTYKTPPTHTQEIFIEEQWEQQDSSLTLGWRKQWVKDLQCNHHNIDRSTTLQWRLHPSVLSEHHSLKEKSVNLKFKGKSCRRARRAPVLWSSLSDPCVTCLSVSSTG